MSPRVARALDIAAITVLSTFGAAVLGAWGYGLWLREPGSIGILLCIVFLAAIVWLGRHDPGPPRVPPPPPRGRP